MIIRKLPLSERPREKMVNFGAVNLSNIELLGLLIRTGTKNRSAMDLAAEIISLDDKGILYLSECSLDELGKVKGIGQAKACQLLAAIELGRRIATTPRNEKTYIEKPEDIVNIFMEEMRYYKKEHFNVVLIDSKGGIITIDKVAVGDLSSAVIHPREVFQQAVKKSAAAVVFAHNHPSGNPKPSNDDICLTKRLSEAGEILGIKVLDHIVIGDGNYISFRNEQLLV